MTYKTILADPPWRYGNWTNKKNGAAASAMETMSLADMLFLPVEDWADPEGCHLFMWATFPKLPEAMALIEGWGFTYVTGFPWVKTVPSSGRIKTGVGFWTQGTSELMLIARKSRLKSKPPKRRKDAPKVKGLSHDEPRVLYHPHTSKHSKKPLTVMNWIEKTVEGPFLELFAREQVKGWACMGLDLGSKITRDGVEFTRSCPVCSEKEVSVGLAPEDVYRIFAGIRYNTCASCRAI